MILKLKKYFALILALVAWFALILMFYAAIKGKSGNLLIESIINYFFYFTIESNIMVGIYFCAKFIDNRNDKPDNPIISGGITVYIFITGLVYFLLLRSIPVNAGIEYKTANILLHCVVPVSCVTYWMVFTEKKIYKWRYSLYWLVFPLAYFFITLLKGFIIEKYPYPFIDVSKYGYFQVMINSLALTIIFSILGLLIILINKTLTIGKYKK